MNEIFIDFLYHKMTHQLIHLLVIDKQLDTNDINKIEEDLFIRLKVKYTDTQTYIFINMTDIWDNNYFTKKYSTLWYCCKITIKEIKTMELIESAVKVTHFYKNNKSVLDTFAKHCKENIDYMKDNDEFKKEIPNIISLFDRSTELISEATQFDIVLLNMIKNHPILHFINKYETWTDIWK